MSDTVEQIQKSIQFLQDKISEATQAIDLLVSNGLSGVADAVSVKRAEDRYQVGQLKESLSKANADFVYSVGNKAQALLDELVKETGKSAVITVTYHDHHGQERVVNLDSTDNDPLEDWAKELVAPNNNPFRDFE